MADKKKEEKSVTLTTGIPGKKARVVHKVFKNKKGDVIVDHTNTNQGKWDKINLTKKGGSRTIKQGVKAVQKFHKSNAHRSQGR